jgi:hypothetical protein
MEWNRKNVAQETIEALELIKAECEEVSFAKNTTIFLIIQPYLYEDRLRHLDHPPSEDELMADRKYWEYVNWKWNLSKDIKRLDLNNKKIIAEIKKRSLLRSA